MTSFLFSLAAVVTICGAFTYFLYLGEVRAEETQRAIDRLRERQLSEEE